MRLSGRSRPKGIIVCTARTLLTVRMNGSKAIQRSGAMLPAAAAPNKITATGRANASRNTDGARDAKPIHTRVLRINLVARWRDSAANAHVGIDRLRHGRQQSLHSTNSFF